MERQGGTRDLQLRREVSRRIAFWTSLHERSEQRKPAFLRQRTQCDNSIFRFHISNSMKVFNQGQAGGRRTSLQTAKYCGRWEERLVSTSASGPEKDVAPTLAETPHGTLDARSFHHPRALSRSDVRAFRELQNQGSRCISNRSAHRLISASGFAMDGKSWVASNAGAIASATFCSRLQGRLHAGPETKL
jgi:hypothetical protein